MNQKVVPLRIADANQNIRHVFIHDLIVEARIGIYKHEKNKNQRIRINLDLSVKDDGPSIRDDIDQVVCYEQVVKDTKSIIAQGHINLVETLAEKVAERILLNPATTTVRVRIEKLDVLLDVASVGVEIERTTR